MKKHSFFKKVTALTSAVAIMISSVIASSISVFADFTPQQSLSDWGYDFRDSGLPDAYDPITGKNDDNQFRYKWANDFFTWKNSTTGKIAYCVQFGETSYDSREMSEDKNLENYYSSGWATLLERAMIYGYKGTTRYGYTKNEEQVATQCMVWAISGKFFDNSSNALSTNERKLLNCIKAPSTSAKNNMINCYEKMKADILSHTTIFSKGYTTAANANSHKIKLTYNDSTVRWEATVASNAWISKFSHESISGVTFTISGNNLKISATTTGMKNLESHGAVKFTKTTGQYGKPDEVTAVFLKSKSQPTQSKIEASASTTANVYAYLAFEGGYGNATITKTAADANGKTYTATSTNNSALNKAVRFKIKAPNGEYVNATKGGNGQYTFTSFATGQTFALNADGKFSVSGLPNGTYTLVETATATGYTKAADKKFTAVLKTALEIPLGIC